MTKPVTVLFICPQCNAGYQAMQTPKPEGASGNFQCHVCSTDLYSWSGGYGYVDWQAVETLPRPKFRNRPDDLPSRPGTLLRLRRTRAKGKKP
jgi:hypothetical protein